MNSSLFFSSRPATRFGEAYPLGNGRTGAMVFGGTGEERLLLSENTFFSGSPSGSNSRDTAPAAFRRMRELITGGNYAEAEKEAQNFIGIRGNYGTSLPVGDLILSDLSPGRTGNYKRELDIREGTARCSFASGENRIERKTWISSAMNCLIHEIRSDGDPLELKVDFSAYSDICRIDPSEGGFSFSTQAVESMHSDGQTGVTLYGQVRIITDGTWRSADRTVAGAGYLIVCLAMVTDFHREASLLSEEREKAAVFLSGLTREIIREGESAHKAEMEELFDRSVLELDEGDGRDLIPLLYHYGRYLLYSSSRSGSPLPAHLQGIWNDNVACRIGWTCDMHLDINTQMNYWPAEITGLPEINEPLFSWIENILVPQGRIAARESYGLPGWSAEIVSNAWGFAAPYWGAPIAPCPGCGIWILTHFYEHFLFTDDRAFLTERAFPLIDESVRFFESYLFEDGAGRYTSGPAISPENSFLVEDRKGYMSHGSTFEILMVRELFDIFLKASEYLDPDKRDGDREGRIRHMRDKLIPYRILDDGTLAEWDHDFPPADGQHRHTSHLLGLYPFAQITPEATPELALAAERTIGRKTTPPENWEDTGWARSMLILYSARLCRGEEAYSHIEAMLDKLLEPNGMIIHPPTRGAASFDNVYEMDGNTGLTSGIAEMLLQSHDGKIRLLPALPPTWKKGRVSGLKARGNITVSLTWEEGAPREIVLESYKKKEVVLCYGNREEPVVVCGKAVFNGKFLRKKQ